MAVTAAYAPPLRASIWPARLKRTMGAKSVYAPAVPADNPMTPSMIAPFGVPSNCTVNDSVCGANALFNHAAALCWHAPDEGMIPDPRLKLQSVSVPTPVYAAQLASAVTPLCSLRN